MRTGTRPLDGVDLFVVGLQVVDAGVTVHAPDLEGHVVRAGGKKLALRVPLDCVHLNKEGKKKR